uniref:Leucine-rich repeat-containing N-terminal plant-type domain-containing protein n=1 Tax=Lactuca sativa TaxID=4236 RepID=A0A9R1XI22_LACSA|nr:hypothetical protein LSAT_V11C400172000 [Lactuca sativa]
MLIMFDPSSILSCILTFLSTILFFLVTVNALREIAKELGKEDWNFDLNTCDGDPSWNTNVQDPSSQYNNSVVCDCSSVKGQDLAGVLPPSLAKLPNIKIISATANRLTGSIPTFLGNITSLLYLYTFSNFCDDTL